MNGRIYAQRGDERGWVKCAKTAQGICLTNDVTESSVFDVDNIPAFMMINGMIESGYTVCIGDTNIHSKVAEPSASPFTTIA